MLAERWAVGGWEGCRKVSKTADKVVDKIEICSKLRVMTDR
jgi:hypothetical protein